MQERLMTEIECMISLAARDPKPIEAMCLKLFEEGGELAEAVNHKCGYLPHKTMKEPLVGEVADVINTAVSIFAKAHPELTTAEMVDLLVTQMNTKNKKWASLIGGI